MTRAVTILLLVLTGIPASALAQNASSDASASADDSCPKGNLLSGKKPLRWEDFHTPKAATDGIASEEGGVWNSNLAARFASPGGFVTWDLGKVTRIRAAFFQGDDNDTYPLYGSNDRREWTMLWEIPTASGGGLRNRLTTELDGSYRYLKVADMSGDDAYSIGELQVFCEKPAQWPPPMNIQKSKKNDTKKKRKLRLSYGKMGVGILGFTALLLVLVPVGRRRLEDEKAPPTISESPAGAIGAFLSDIQSGLFSPDRRLDWPVWIDRTVLVSLGVLVPFLAKHAGQPERWLLIGMGTAVLLLLGNRFRRARVLAAEQGDSPAAETHVNPWVQRITLVGLIVVGGFTWVNFSTFHGWRAVHLHDTFHYYMGGKYFPETRYHLLYDCAATADIDEGKSRSVARRRIRNLRNNKLEKAQPIVDGRHQECRDAFTAERWDAFKADIAFFRKRMGADTWDRMFKDHGYNASPVWTMAGRTWANLGPIDDTVLKRNAGIDYVLYISIGLLIIWAFGLKAAAVASLTLGVGYPWAYFWTGGAYGRIGWLFMLVLGVCLLKKNKPFAGGFALMWAGLLRMFPLAIFGGLALKIGIDFYKNRTISPDHKRGIAGASLGLILLVGVSSLPGNGGAHAWPEFFENSMKHTATPLTNHMGLPTLISWHPSYIARHTRDGRLQDPFEKWKDKRRSLKKSRVWLYAPIVLGFFVLIGYMRRYLREDWEITAASTLFIVALFELTCYYYNFMILFALLASQRLRHIFALGLMCVGTQIANAAVGWYDEQYLWESALVLLYMLYLLADVAMEGRRQEAAAGEAVDDTSAARTEAQPA
jgi:hypothetical protein